MTEIIVIGHGGYAEGARANLEMALQAAETTRNSVVVFPEE